MKILFVYPNFGFPNVYAFQCGLAYISAVLKERGHSTKLITLIKKRDIAKLKGLILEYNPDLIAFSAVSTQFPYIEGLAKEVKKNTNALLIVGGIHVTIVPEELEKSHYIDGIIRGEGEYPLLDLVNALQNKKDYLKILNLWIKKNGKIYKNKLRPPIKNLDTLPFPDRGIFNYQEIIDQQDGQATFIFSRGCPYNCSYCCNHVLSKLYNRNYFRIRSVKKALDEIRLATQNYKVKHFFFDDDIFSLDREWTIKFLIAYKKEFGIPFGCNLRPGSADESLLRLFKEAGCDSFSIGIESGNEHIRKKILNRHMSNDSIIQFFKLIKKVGIQTKTYNLIGLPYETPEKFKDTIKLNSEINPHDIILGIFHPYPGTKLAKICKENNLTSEHKLISPERSDTILNLPDFNRKQILKYYRNFGYLVYQQNFYKKALYFKFKSNRLFKMIYWFAKPFFRNIVQKAFFMKLLQFSLV